MVVNELNPRTKPKDKVCLYCHKSLATNCYISHLIGPDRQMRLVFHSNYHSKQISKETNSNGVVPTVIVHCGSPAASTSLILDNLEVASLKINGDIVLYFDCDYSYVSSKRRKEVAKG